MEFYKEVVNSRLNKENLKNLLTIKALPELCASISSVISDVGNHGIIYCLWGEFAINREDLEHGIRFTLPKCPNALAWTVTTDDGSDTTVVHCTINKQEHDEDFIESIREFVDDWAEGLSTIKESGCSTTETA